jgi:amino acid transporter
MGHLIRRISPLTLFMLSMNGIIGSGWLFAPFFAAKIAGPASIFSWVIGGVSAILIAFTFAELASMLPIAGGTAHIPQLSHGTFASFILGWIAWLTALILAPIEVQAVLQYASLYFPSLMREANNVPVLSLWGYFWATVLMIGLCLVNIFSYRGLVRFNFILFIFKFSVIILTIFIIIHTKFSVGNFSGMLSSATSWSGWESILSAVSTSGIVLAFNGFKNGVELAGETTNFKVSIPLSTAGSVVACLLLYLGLQICLVGALDMSDLAKGWGHLTYQGDVGPFVGLAAVLGLPLLLRLLYLNAVISPLSAGLVYVTTTARILYAMSRIGYVPRFLSRLNHQRFPVWAIVVNFLLGMLSFLPLPGWQAMVNFLVSAIVVTYAMGPIALLCLRLSMPDKPRPFRLPFAVPLCFFAFYSCNLFSYWIGWETISKFAIALVIGLSCFAMAYSRGKVEIDKSELKAAYWLLPYLLGLIVISYLGSFGGRRIITFGWDFLIIGLFSILILYLSIRTRSTLTAQEIEDYLIAKTISLEP